MDAINTISLPVTPVAEAPKPQAPVVAAPVVSQTNTNDSAVDIVLSDQAKQSQINPDEQKKDSSQSKKSDPYFEELEKAQAERRAEARRQAEEEAKRAAAQLRTTVDYLARLAYAKTIADQPLSGEPLPQPTDILTKLDLIA